MTYTIWERFAGTLRLIAGPLSWYDAAGLVAFHRGRGLDVIALPVGRR